MSKVSKVDGKKKNDNNKPKILGSPTKFIETHIKIFRVKNELVRLLPFNLTVLLSRIYYLVLFFIILG